MTDSNDIIVENLSQTTYCKYQRNGARKFNGVYMPLTIILATTNTRFQTP